DVNPEDDPPVVVAAIANVSANEDAADTTIDLSNVFTDVDNEDSTIVKTVNNNTNPSLVSANISGNTLTLSYLADQIGTADITVQAESNGKQVLDTFTVTVTALDDPPEILQSINDVTANEDDANDTIDLTNVFTDKDSDNNAITKTILTNNNESLLTASISGNTLTLAYLADQNGTAEITVLATSNGLNVTDSFMVTVAAMDDSPQLSVEIDDVVVNENANDTIIPLTNVFVDIDKDVIVKTVEINTNETLVTAIISGNTLTLKYQPDTSGNAAITIRGTSNGQFEEDTFMITVISVDSPPEVANEIADVSVDMNAASMAIALTDVFFDPDNDIISISLQNNANPELVTPTVSGNNLYLSFQSSLIGEAEITIRATANGKTVDEIFIIYVTATDVGPEVSMPISDITVLEDSSDSIVNLESVFTDPDDDDQNIVKSVYSNSNDALVTASASGNELTLSYVHNASGTATIVIRGTSKGKTVDTSFKLTVLPVDDPPMTANPIEHITTEEDALSQTIDLINVFSDIDSDDNNILKTLTENTNNSLVSASISNNELLLSYQPEQSGTATITVRGTSNGLFVETSFSVTVNSVDDPPVVINSIDDITMDASADTKVIALTDVFTDIDNNDASIVKSIQNNTNSNLVTTFIADNSLTLSLQPGMEGEAQITVKAISNGLTVNDSFNVFVDASDLAPVLANPIEDITVVENAASTIIPLASVFTDPDNDDLTIEKTIHINTNEQLVTGIINGNQLTLTYAPDINGVATLTVRGISKGKTVDNTFNVTVLAIDSPPEIIDPLKDVMVDEDAAKMAIPLTGVFTDVDNDDSYMTLSIVENNNETLLIAIVENNNLSLDYQPNQYGSALITIQAMSNGLTVIDQISIAVNPVDDPPEIGTYIDDVTVNEDADNTIIDLSTAFTDIDNETIVKTVQNNTQPSLVAATIIDNTLTLDYLADQNGIAVITIAGLSNGKTVTQTFQVSVASINDAPQADDSQISVLEDTHATAHLQAKDIEQDALTFNLISQPQHGQLTLIDQFTGEFIFVPDNNFYGSDAFTFNVSDGQLTSQTAQVTIMITPVNDLPFMSELTNLEIYEGATLTKTFTVSDADRKHLTITAITSDTQLLPYEQFTWLGGQAIHSNKVLVDVNAGDISVSLTIKPASGLSGTASVTLITIDEAGATIEKAFIVLVKKYHILATSQGPGKIQPSGIVEVNTGEPYVKFTITPETGYVVDHIIVDGNKLSARPMYTFWNVSEDHAITAIFSEPVIYTISTQAGSGGSIEPSGNVLVEEGNSKTFKIQANTGFVIDYLRVDDVYVAATNEYIFNNVSKPHKLQAFFEAVPAPIASFKASPVSGSSPLEVSFTDQSQNTITSHEWNYGDGTSGVLQNPKHTYFSPGKYTVSLTVKGPGGSDTLVKSNLIVIHDLQVEFTATPTSGAFPLTSTFTAQTQDALTGVIWNFGDGNTSTQLQASHVYNAPGSYTVQLTAFAQGTSATVVKTNYINVKGRNISGRVTGSDTGMGLAGYQVEVIHRQDNLRVGETYTDANGYYTFVCESSVLTCLTTFQKIPATSDLVLAVWPPFMKNDYYMQYYSGQSLAGKATLISTVDSNQTNINLVLEKVNNNAITGKVHDNGVPEANIQVNVYSEKLSYGLSTLADTNGVYTLNGLKPSDDYCVYVWDDQQNTETYFSLPANQTPGQDIPSYSVYKKDSATQVEPTNPALKNIDILFDRNVNERGSIKGNISTSDNKAANGIWVYAFSDAIGTGNGAFTDQNGDYTITGLTQVSDSDPYTMGYIVAVHSVQDNQSNINTNLWYTYQAYPGVTDKSLAEKVKTGTNNINFTLKTQCSLSGTVSDIYGSTVPGAEVKVRSDKTGQVVSAVTNQFGKYAITGLSPVDDYLVTASAVYYPLMYYKGKSTQAQADRVDLSKDDVTGIDFALDTGLIIQGVIYLENSTETAPEGLWVNIWSETTSTGSDVPTDSNGRYQITGLNPNATDYIISIRKQDYMASFYRDNKDTDLMNDTVYSSEDAQGVSATDLQNSVDRNLILRTGLTISGIVQYNGLPVSDIRVEAWSESTGGWGIDVSSDTITDSFNYKITGLPPGEYNVKIQPLYYQDDSYRVELSNEDIKNLYFPLKDLENMICGTVNGLDAGKKAQITAWSEGTGFNKILMLTGTGNDIDYTITQVKPSTDYRVKFTGYDYPLQVYNKKTNEEEANLITVSSGIVSGIDFHITSGTQMISGTITFPGSAVAGDIAWVDAFSPSTGSDGSAKVILVEGRTANYQITGLKEAPDFTVVAWGKQYKEQYYSQKTDVANANLINTGDAILDDSIDFDLTPGATISGTIYEDGLPIEGFQISAISDKTSSFGGATSASDGSYLIEGLDLANDFVIKAQKSGMAPFYYNGTSTTRDEKLATRVSTVEKVHVTGINIQTALLESISGTVRDEEGKALSGIWINVWSDLQKTGEGMYTLENGSYIINALPKSEDYKVSIGEHAALIYVPEEKTGVKSNSSGIDFTLRRAYQLKGTVGNTAGEILVKAEVELYSEKEDFYVWTKTDGSGTYNIQCVPSANDYILSVMPPENTSYITFNESGLQINEITTSNRSMQKDIILKTGSHIEGYVYKTDTTTPVIDSEIFVYSKGNNFSAEGGTDDNGYFRINNIPIASDYEVTVKTTDFAKAIKVDQVAGTSINFVLEAGGVISGKVIEQDGAPLADVLVEVTSQSAHISGIQRTDVNGGFAISGMPRYLDTGYEVTDYVVKVFPNNYAEQSQGQKRVGEYVTFVCKKAIIKGTITDSLGNPIPDGVIVAIKLYNNLTEGGYIKKTDAASDGTFSLEGMLFNKDYQIVIHVMKSKMSNKVQWISQNGAGISGRSEAGKFQAGSNVDVQLMGTWDK
ncbi:peptidase, partial [Candidatus Magnetomorum sp. HK-1]